MLVETGVLSAAAVSAKRSDRAALRVMCVTDVSGFILKLCWALS
jgi:hypothetical protein